MTNTNVYDVIDRIAADGREQNLEKGSKTASKQELSCHRSVPWISLVRGIPSLYGTSGATNCISWLIALGVASIYLMGFSSQTEALQYLATSLWSGLASLSQVMCMDAGPYSWKTFCTQLTKAYMAEVSCISCYWFCYVSAHDQFTWNCKNGWPYRSLSTA